MPYVAEYDAYRQARFGPQGGNRQPAHWNVVRDATADKSLLSTVDKH